MRMSVISIYRSVTFLTHPVGSIYHHVCFYYSSYYNIESIVAHEYFHNYTGNRVTCRDWFQITLKEGLTVLRDQQFSEDIVGYDMQRIRNAKIMLGSQFREAAGPTAHSIYPESYISPDNLYTTTVYEKGVRITNHRIPYSAVMHGYAV